MPSAAARARSRELLGEGRWLLRAAAPPELLPLMRLLAGLAGNLATLDVALPWWPVLLDVVGPRDLAATPATALVLAPGHGDEPTASGELRLCVEIRRGQDVVFATALPARAALDLGAWLPLAIRQRLAAAGVDLGTAERRCRQAGLVAGELFSGQRGERTLRVWLGADAPASRLGLAGSDDEPEAGKSQGVA